MNMFYLSTRPQECAEWSVNSHCVKMILESAQLLSTAHRVLDGVQYIDASSGRKIKRWRLDDWREDKLYSATNINHPCAIWCREQTTNYRWLHDLLGEYCGEYTYRYGKVHKVESSGLMQTLKNNIPKNISNQPFTEPTPAMPEHCKVPGDSITSYRNYYFQEKGRMWSWSGKINSRHMPVWLSDKINYDKAVKSNASV